MFENIEQLEQARQALLKVENALYALKNKIYSTNPELFEAMAEDYVKVKEEIANDINTFLGVNEFYEHKAMLWMRLVGDNIRLLTTPASIWSSTLNKLRNSIGSIARSVGPSTFTSTPLFEDYIKIISDFSVVGLQNSSLKIGIALPTTVEPELFSESSLDFIERLVYETLNSFLLTANWFVRGKDANELNKYFPNEQTRDLVISKVLSFIPTNKSAIRVFEWSGDIVPGHNTIKLTPQIRIRVRELIKKEKNELDVTEECVIREIDLDKGKLILRQRPDGKDELPCRFKREVLQQVRDALDLHVRITGTIHEKRIQPLNIRYIEVLE